MARAAHVGQRPDADLPNRPLLEPGAKKEPDAANRVCRGTCVIAHELMIDDAVRAIDVKRVVSALVNYQPKIVVRGCLRLHVFAPTCRGRVVVRSDQHE